MNFGRIFIASVTALVVAVPLIGGSMLNGKMAIANQVEDGAQLRRAAKEADAASKALRRGEGQRAVTHAETAVTLDPRNSAHRSLLGEAYLFAGRFISANQALNEALSLDPANGRIALNLALSQIATGDWVQARATLATHSGTIPVSDRGLAMALAGDPNHAVAMLMDAARQSDADAKTRQNLALSLALSGQWQQARTVASLDLSPALLDQRMLEWASFARPNSAHDQVAKLLGVSAVADGGQPTQLALARSMSTAVAVAHAVDPASVQTRQLAPGPLAVEAQATLATLSPDGDIGDVGMTDAALTPLLAETRGPMVIFAPRREIVQSIPANLLRAPIRSAQYGAGTPLISQSGAAPISKAALVKPRAFTQASGRQAGWFVQLGAYDSGGVARDAWGRLARRTPELKGMTPSSGSISTSAGAFHRLSVGGLTRSDAVSLCRQVRRSGNDCFVRTGAGDRPASWSRRSTV